MDVDNFIESPPYLHLIELAKQPGASGKLLLQKRDYR